MESHKYMVTECHDTHGCHIVRNKSNPSFDKVWFQVHFSLRSEVVADLFQI